MPVASEFNKRKAQKSRGTCASAHEKHSKRMRAIRIDSTPLHSRFLFRISVYMVLLKRSGIKCNGDTRWNVVSLTIQSWTRRPSAFLVSSVVRATRGRKADATSGTPRSQRSKEKALSHLIRSSFLPFRVWKSSFPALQSCTACYWNRYNISFRWDINCLIEFSSILVSADWF